MQQNRTSAYDNEIARVLFTREQIAERVRALGAGIARHYGSANELTLVPILSGSIIFLADLIRELPLRMKIALIHVSAYPGAATTPGDPKMLLNLTADVSGRHVLIVDDILDTGRTLRRVQSIIAARRPASLSTAVLLRKPGKAPDVPVDFIGFDVEDQFVVGYGLDFDDQYRNYPHIGVLRPESTP